MQLTPEDIDSICDLVLDLCGVYLDQSKAYLIEARLKEIAKRASCENYNDLVERVRRGADLKLQCEVVDAITTHETHFFRDVSPFEALKNKVLPELFDAVEASPFPNRIRIWSAACSTGQEPYSIAMTICELLPDPDAYSVEILATDVSDAAVAKASRGLYRSHELERGLPEAYRQRYFHQVGTQWQTSDRIRSMIAFRRFNLHDSFATLGQFDVIFCRNVAIYFTPQARERLFVQMSSAMTQRGYLFLGSAESLRDLGPRFAPQQHCRATCYRLNSSQPALA